MIGGGLRYYGDFFTVPVMIALALAVAGISLATIVFAAVGLLLWTLIEYVIHRALHDRSGDPRASHTAHHDDEHSTEVQRSSLTTPAIVAAVALALAAIFGVSAGLAILAGLLAGYLWFICLHHAAHLWPIKPGSWLYAAKHRHALHHHRGPGNYGVVTPLWDIVFRTNR